MLTSLLKKKRSHKNSCSLPPFAPKEFYPPLLSSIPKCTSSRPLDNQTYFAARRVDDIKISKSEGGEGIFLPSLAGEPRWNIFRRGARPIKFARPRRAIIHGVPRATRLPPFFRNPLPPSFFGSNVFKAPRAANRKRLCLARVTARPNLALDLSSRRTLLPISPFRGGFLWILLFP